MHVRRILRLHVNGRTVLSWWVSDYANVDLPTANPSDRFRIDFDDGRVELNGAMIYRFHEAPIPPEQDFHRIEFLYDNHLYIIEYRRESYEEA